MDGALSAKSVAGVKVLVVDDQDCVVDLLVDIVQELGFSSERAHDGLEAMKRFDSEKLQLVITDIKMPKMDGIDLMKGIKQRRPETPVIAITGYGCSGTEEELLREGMDAFLEKPFHLAKIENTICSLLRKFELLG